MHYGSFPGYYSLATLIPSQSLAIFTSINGGHQGLPYTINSLIHTYIMDLAFKETPWLTPENACQLFNHEMDYNVTMDFDRSKPPPRPLSEYTGHYYHAVFGDLFIRRKDHKLKMFYGKMEFTLFVHDGDTFYAEPIDLQWMMLAEKVTFNRRNRNSEMIMDIEVPFLERSALPVFLKLPHDVSSKQWKGEIDKSCSKKTLMPLCSSGAKSLSYTYQMSFLIILVGIMNDKIHKL